MFIIFSCAEDTLDNDIVAPAPPEFIQKSVEFAQIETGIDAVPQGNWIYLEWVPNTEEDLEGYEIWRRFEDDSSQSFTLLEILPLTQIFDPQNPQYTDRSPEIAPDPLTGQERGYYYYLTAYDENGNISIPSDTVYYRLMRKPVSVSFNANYDSVQWSYPYNIQYDIEFVIRLYKEIANTYIWLARYSGGQDPYSVKYNFDGSSGLMGAGEYWLRVDVMPQLDQGDKYSGAESQQYNFTIQ